MHEPVARIAAGRMSKLDGYSFRYEADHSSEKHSGEKVAAQQRRFLIRVHSIFNRLIRTGERARRFYSLGLNSSNVAGILTAQVCNQNET